MSYLNIKSKYILKRIICNKKRREILKLIHYNKKLQEILNISIENYIELFYRIEINLTLISNIKEKSTFVNIRKNEEPYFHIYFNGNKNEIYRNYITKDDKVQNIKIIIDKEIESLALLFQRCHCIKKITFTKFDLKNIIKRIPIRYIMDRQTFIFYAVLEGLFQSILNYCMMSMFEDCKSLKEINFSKFNTENVKKMDYMFQNCSSLKKLDLSNFNTSKVTLMTCMFYMCSSLKEINLTNFNTENVTSMNLMFYGCSSLKELNLSNFNTNKLKDMTEMFGACSSLKELNLTNFNTKNVTNMLNMFFECSDELKLKIKNQYKNFKEEAFF